MTKRDEIVSKLRAFKKRASGRYPIAAMALFGSVARNEQSDVSDVDVLVEFNGRIGSGFLTLAFELEEELGTKVDLVSRGGIKPKYFRAIEPDLIYV